MLSTLIATRLPSAMRRSVDSERAMASDCLASSTQVRMMRFPDVPTITIASSWGFHEARSSIGFPILSSRSLIEHATSVLYALAPGSPARLYTGVCGVGKLPCDPLARAWKVRPRRRVAITTPGRHTSKLADIAYKCHRFSRHCLQQVYRLIGRAEFSRKTALLSFSPHSIVSATKSTRINVSGRQKRGGPVCADTRSAGKQQSLASCRRQRLRIFVPLLGQIVPYSPPELTRQ